MEEVKFLISLNKLLQNLEGFVPYQRQIRKLSLEVCINRTSNYFTNYFNSYPICHYRIKYWVDSAQRSRRDDRRVHDVTAYENGSKASTFIKAEAQLYCPYPLIM
jgi:hypothetical protein